MLVKKFLPLVFQKHYPCSEVTVWRRSETSMNLGLDTEYTDIASGCNLRFCGSQNWGLILPMHHRLEMAYPLI